MQEFDNIFHYKVTDTVLAPLQAVLLLFLFFEIFIFYFIKVLINKRLLLESGFYLGAACNGDITVST